jgi:hypothetical protein
MRIFLSCQQALRSHRVPAYSFWETYFKKGVEEAGHQWVEAETIDWAEGLTHFDKTALQSWRDRTWSLVISSIQQHHQRRPIDLFLSYLFPKQIERSAVQAIQSLDIPCINFFCDNVREFIQVPQEFYDFDLHWVPEFKALQLYQKAKLNYIYAPMPVWIPPQQRSCLHPENYSISFIGSRDVQREALLAQALQAGGNIEIRGAGWMADNGTASSSQDPQPSLWQKGLNQWHFLAHEGLCSWTRKMQAKFQPQIPNDTWIALVKPQPETAEYIAILQQSRVTLGINRYPSYRHPFARPDTFSRMRDIEAPMMGACYLTEWTAGLEHLYELGEEIAIYRTAEEMVEQLQILEANPFKRKQLRIQGQKRALAEHTVAKSLKRIANALSL